MFEITVRPPNSLVLVVTARDPEIPDSMHGELVASTATCIAIGTLNELDGETTIRLTSATASDGEDTLRLVFERTLDNPSGFVRVVSVNGDVYIEQPSAGRSIPISIFANDSTEPDIIVIEIPSD